MPRKHNPYDNYKAVLDKAAGLLGLTQNDYITLKYRKGRSTYRCRSRWTTARCACSRGSACSIELARAVQGGHPLSPGRG